MRRGARCTQKLLQIEAGFEIGKVPAATEIPDHRGIDFRDPVFSSVDG